MLFFKLHKCFFLFDPLMISLVLIICFFIFIYCRFVYVFPPHTKVLLDVLIDFLLDWNMGRNVSTIIVDNCSSNDEMLNILVEKLSLSGSLLLN